MLERKLFRRLCVGTEYLAGDIHALAAVVRPVICLVLLALLLSSMQCVADTISGTVTVSGGGALSGAVVRTAGDPSYSVTTGTNGAYSLTLPPGAFTVLASKSGYDPQRMAVPTGAGTVNFALYTASSGSMTLPAPLDWGEPPGAPTAPGDNYPIAFADTCALPDANAPKIAGYSEFVKPDESFTVTGWNFTTRTGDDAGTDTTVWVWARTSSSGGVLKEAKLWKVSSGTITATLPNDIPLGMYLVWVQNSVGVSAPICLNRTTSSWIGPSDNITYPGGTKRVFGRNLTYNHSVTRAGTSDPATSYVYIQPAGGGSFISCPTTTPVPASAPNLSEPYAVMFTVPAGTSNGNYKVFVHNGQGGQYGWSDGLDLVVQTQWQRGTGTVSVNPGTDPGRNDSTNIQTALNTVGGYTNGGTVQLGSGNFILRTPISIPANVNLAGAGMNSTTLRLQAATNGTENVGYPTYPTRTAIAVVVNGNRGAVSDLTIHQIYGYGIPSQELNVPVDMSYATLSNIRIKTDEGDSNWVNTNADSWLGTAVEIRGCELGRSVASQGNCWMHDNTFYGDVGPWWGAEAPAQIYGFNSVFEQNHTETQDWPIQQNGSSNYDITANNWALFYKVWAKRVALTMCSYGYFGHNTADDVAVDDNRGEMILFHPLAGEWWGQVLSNDGLTMTVRTDGKLFDQTVDPLENGYGNTNPLPCSQPFTSGDQPWQQWYVGRSVSIVSGRGAGQVRMIWNWSNSGTGYGIEPPNKLTVDKPWTVAPDSTSVIIIGPIFCENVVYGNTLNAFPPNYTLADSYTKCSASQPTQLANSYRSVFEANTSRRTNAGSWVVAGNTWPSMWNEMRDNQVIDAMSLGYMLQQTENNPYAPELYGNAIRSSSCNVVLPAAHNSGFSAAMSYGGEGNILENLDLTGSTGYYLGYNSYLALGSANLYRNGSVTVSTSSDCPVYINSRDGGSLLVTNAYSGASLNYYYNTGLSSYNVPIASYRVARFTASYGGGSLSPVLIPIANAGTAAMTWTPVTDSSWITAGVQANGTVTAEDTAGSLSITPDTTGMTVGRHWGSVTVYTTSGYAVAKVGVVVDITSSSQVAAPTFNPEADVAGSHAVTIASATSGATIYYTTDGTTPTSSASLYSGELTVNQGTVLKAIACKAGMTDSVVTGIAAAAPTFSLAFGQYDGSQSTTISTITSGATIRYTIDGTLPSESHGSVYSGQVTINSTCKLRAIAYKAGMADSDVTSGDYTITGSGWEKIGSTSTDTYLAASNGPGNCSTGNVFSSTGNMPSELAVSGGVVPDFKVTYDMNVIYDGCYGTWSIYGNNGLGLYLGATPSGSSGLFTGVNGVYTGTDMDYAGAIAYNSWSAPDEAGDYGNFTAWSIGYVDGYGAADGLNVTVQKVGSTATTTVTDMNSKVYTVTSTDATSWTGAGKFAAFHRGGATSYGQCSVKNITFYKAAPAAEPTFDPGPGTYSGTQSVTITSTTSDASIRYTTDGTTPSATVGTAYSGAVSISSSCTLKAIACKTGMRNSTVTSGTYTISSPCNAPTFSPAAGSYTGTQSVTISTTTTGASIRYTTDGTTPSDSVGTAYSSAVSIGSSCTLKAIAYKSGMANSDVTSGAYTISSGGGGGGWEQIGSTSTDYYLASSTGVPLDMSTGDHFSVVGNMPSELAVSGGVVPDFKVTYDLIVIWDGGSGNWSMYGNNGLALYASSTPTGSNGLFTGVNGRYTGSDMVFAGAIAYNNWSAPEESGNYGGFSGSWYLGYVNYGGQYYGGIDVFNVSVEKVGSTATTTVTNMNSKAYTVTSSDATNWTGGKFAAFHKGGTLGSYGQCSVTNIAFYKASVAAAPTFSPAAGTYSSAQSVTITTTTSGAGIRYTTDGTTPSDSVGTVYSSAVNIDRNLTLKAIAYKSGMTNSAVTSGAYTINCAAPTFSPAAGSYTSTQSVTITTTSGASIRYTTDGTTPSDSVGTVYSSAVSIGSSCTLKAIAYKSNMGNSDLTSGAYTISICAAPTFSPVAGTYSTAQSVTITTTTSGASIRYTTDGTTPNDSVGTVYSSAVNIGSSCTLKAIAYKSGMGNSTVTGGAYAIGWALDTTVPGTFSAALRDSFSATANMPSWTTFSGTAIPDVRVTYHITEGNHGEGNFGLALWVGSTPSASTGLFGAMKGNWFGLQSIGLGATASYPSYYTLTYDANSWSYLPTEFDVDQQVVTTGGVTTVTLAVTNADHTSDYWMDYPTHTVTGTFNATSSVSAWAGNSKLAAFAANGMAGTEGYAQTVSNIQFYKSTVVAAPTYSPVAGTYSSAQSVTITTTTSGAGIRYTTDGTTPSDSVGTVYSGAVSVPQNLTLKAIAYKAGMINSAVTSGAYTINCAAPSFSPAAGNYGASTSVTITTATTGANIRYTTDGSTPSDSVGAVYSTPVPITSNQTLKAIAYKTGMANSSVTSGAYTFFIGNNTVGGSNQSFSSGRMYAARFQAPASFTASSIYVDIATSVSNKHIKCAIYSDSSGNPGSFLMGTNELTNPGTGWKTFTLTSGQSLTSGTYYWLTMWADGAYAVKGDSTGGTYKWKNQTYGTWPSSFGTAGGSGTIKYSIYAQ